MYQEKSEDEREPHIRLRNKNIGAIDSISTPSTTRKYGDWDCPSCCGMNFASRTVCYKCSAPKPNADSKASTTVSIRNPSTSTVSVLNPSSTRKAGDWSCNSCSALNFAKRSSCYACCASKLEPDSSDTVAKPSTTRKAGDWDCRSCGSINFAKRVQCYKCGSN